MKKEYEIIITSSGSSEFKRFKVKGWVLKLTLYLIIAIFTFLGVAAVFYGKVYITALRVKKLEAENRKLRAENARITELERKVEKLEVLREKLYSMLGYDKAPQIKPFTTSSNLSPVQSESFDRKVKNKSSYSPGMSDLLLQAFKEDSITPRGMPVKGVITRGYGPVHKAIDIGAGVGSPVRATAFGIVDSVYYDMRLGNVVVLKHGDEYKTLYGHLQNVRVYPGKNVVRGEVLGEVGLSGLTTGPHLHYEVRKKGKTLNPLYFVND